MFLNVSIMSSGELYMGIGKIYLEMESIGPIFKTPPKPQAVLSFMK